MNRNTENGNVLILILVAVILFGALSFTVGQMLRSGNAEAIGEQQASIYADEILGYAQQMRQAVQGMRISSGCDETEISFENAVVAGYTNGANTDCQVFHSDGGGMTYITPSSDFGTGTEWVFSGRPQVHGVGTTDTLLTCATCADLVVSLYNVLDIICTRINEKMGISGIPQDSGDLNIEQFTGSYSGSDSISGCPTNAAASCPSGTFESSELWSKPVGCFEEGATGNNVFYQVLLTR